MTRRDWYVGIGLLLLALLAHAAFPRYEWRHSQQYNNVLIRIDRWTGRAEIGIERLEWGRWVPQAEYSRFTQQDP